MRKNLVKLVAIVMSLSLLTSCTVKSSAKILILKKLVVKR